jgi:hypothetical protein
MLLFREALCSKNKNSCILSAFLIFNALFRLILQQLTHSMVYLRLALFLYLIT